MSSNKCNICGKEHWESAEDEPEYHYCPFCGSLLHGGADRIESDRPHKKSNGCGNFIAVIIVALIIYLILSNL